MKLFYAPPSPFARKARIVVRERGLMDQIEEIAVTPYQDDARLLAATPAGLVPALTLNDGSTLIDSPLICQYLDAIASGPLLVPTDSPARWKVINHGALGDAIMDFALEAVIEMRRTDTPPSKAFIERKRGKVKRCLAALPVSSGDAPLTLGDVTAACALAYLDFRLANLDWRALRPDLASWHATIESRSAFQDTQPAENPS